MVLIAHCVNQALAAVAGVPEVWALTIEVKGPLGSGHDSISQPRAQCCTTACGAKAMSSDPETISGIAAKAGRYTEPSTGGGINDSTKLWPVVLRATIRGTLTSSSMVGAVFPNLPLRTTQQ